MLSLLEYPQFKSGLVSAFKTVTKIGWLYEETQPLIVATTVILCPFLKLDAIRVGFEPFWRDKNPSKNS